MPQPLRIQLLSMAHLLKELVKLSSLDFKDNLLLINRWLLELELYLVELKQRKLSRKIRITLNKFEKEFKELKIYLFLTKDFSQFKEKALTWANILTHRAKLA